MKFANASIFHAIWLLLILGTGLWLSFVHYKKIVRRFCESHLLKDMASGLSFKRIIYKSVLILAVFFLSIIALARPQWGFKWLEVKRKGMDIILVIDTSKSMLTQDVKPNRLERTKLAVRDLLNKLKGDRIGLIAFAGDAFLVCPLTVDYNGFFLSLNDLGTGTVPRGGTNISRAIEEAVSSYDKTPDQFKAVIVVTDGDNLEGDPLSVAKKAKEKGIKIYTVGIGTREGELIQIRGDSGQTEFLKDKQGNFVKSRLNENLLQQIALTTGGIYVKASGVEFGLDLIYEQELSKMERREIESKMEKKYHERFQFPLGLAVLLLMIETCLGTRVHKRNKLMESK